MQSETKKPEGEQVWMNLEEFLLVKQRFLENTERVCMLFTLQEKRINVKVNDTV